MFAAALMVVSALGATHGSSGPTSATTPEVRSYVNARARNSAAATRTGGSSSAGLMTLLARAAHRMPLFARKYNVSCNYCHTTIPRLNYTGYRFRAAGFRMPDDIGKPETKKFEFGDYISARIQSRFDVQATNQPNGAAVANVIGGVPGSRTTTVAFSFQEATLYPLTGSFGKHFAAESELSVSPEDFFEVENAYLRFVAGKENAFFTSRVGVFHPWEGFGASDRPFSNARTLFQTVVQSSSGRAVPYVFQPWGLDEVGVEIGGEFSKLSVRGAVLGGTFMRWEEGAKAFIAFPSQTGPWKGANQAVPELGKPFDYVSHNTPDFSANATYTPNAERGTFTLLYYHGNIATPTACTDGTAIGATSGGVVCGVTGSSAAAPYGEAGNTDFDFTSASAFRNNFDRFGAYASYPIGKHFLPAVGYDYGKDTKPDGTKFSSNGLFVDGTYMINKYATVGMRYDRFRPNTSVNTKQWALTPYMNIPLQNGLQFIMEFQHRDFQIAPGTTHRKNDTFQLRLIYIQ